MIPFGAFPHVEVSTEDAFAEAYANLSAVHDVGMVAHLHECEKCQELCSVAYDRCDRCDEEPTYDEEAAYDARSDAGFYAGMSARAERQAAE